MPLLSLSQPVQGYWLLPWVPTIRNGSSFEKREHDAKAYQIVSDLRCEVRFQVRRLLLD